MTSKLMKLASGSPWFVAFTTIFVVLSGCDQGSVSPALSGSGPVAPTASGESPVMAPVLNTDPTTTTFQQQVLTLTNQFRAANGVGPLALNARLTDAAQSYSQVMAEDDIMSHTRPDGATPDQRMAAAGYDPTTWGENIAEGYTTPQDVVAAWESDEGHKANLLNPAFKDIGIGYAMGSSSFWVQDFGAE